MDIFISYRRDGGRDMARSIQLALKAAGYSDVFFDFNSLRDGVFNEQIIDAINECKDFLLILSKGSMDRCANEGDWVRREIKTAIDAGCKIIPVLVESEWNWPESFPKALNIIKSIQFTKVLNDEYFDDYMKRLIERLDSKPNIQNSTSTPLKKSNAFLLKISVDETAEVFINDERIRKVKSGKTCFIDFLERKKKYKVSVQSLAIKKDVIAFEIVIPEFSNEMEKTISFKEIRDDREKKKKEESEKRKHASEIASYERWKLKENRKTLMKQYDFVDSEYENVWIVGKKDDNGIVKYGLVDEQGFEIVQCMFDDAAHMNEGFAALCHDGWWSYYNKEGVPVLEDVSEVPGFFIKGVVPVSQNGKYGLINKDGQLLVPCENEYVLHSTGEFVVVKKKDKEVYLYTHRDSVIKRVAFDEIEHQEMIVSVDSRFVAEIPSMNYSGIYYVSKGDLEGLLDKEGQLLMRCSAQEIEPIGKSLFRVQVLEKYGVFDVEKKKTVIPIKYKTLIPINDYYYFYPNMNLWSLDNSDGCYMVSEIGKLDELFLTSAFGIINSKDEVIIPMEYMYFTNSFMFSAGFGVLCFKQIVCEALDCDNLRHYLGEHLYYFAKQFSFPENSPLRDSKITAVLYQQERPEEPEWRPMKTILYDKGQYKEYGMDGTLRERQVVTIEDEIAWLIKRGFKQYKNPVPFNNINNKVVNHLDGESGRFCKISINGRFGVADEVTGLIVLPADYLRIERDRSRYWSDDTNAIDIKINVNDGFSFQIEIYVLPDSSVWIGSDYRYSEEKQEELLRKYLSFLFNE